MRILIFCLFTFIGSTMVNAQRVSSTYFFYFNSGKISLEKSELKKMNAVCDTLNRFKIVSVSVSGHTDDTDTEENNLILSEDRANFIKGILVERKILESIINIVAMGESNPLESNKTEKGKARNRRVEIKVVYE